MTLEEKLLNDFKQAMKDKDSSKVSTLSFLRAQISYAALEKKKKALDDSECLAVIRKLIKQHQDSIEQFKAGNRLDLVEKEEKELAILKAYLPQEMSADSIKKIIDEAVTGISAQGIKDMGKVMKEVMAKVAGQADAKTVSDLVKERLLKSDGDPKR
jgi:hypothetical protein